MRAVVRGFDVRVTAMNVRARFDHVMLSNVSNAAIKNGNAPLDLHPHTSIYTLSTDDGRLPLYCDMLHRVVVLHLKKLFWPIVGGHIDRPYGHYHRKLIAREVIRYTRVLWLKLPWPQTMDLKKREISPLNSLSWRNT